MRNSGSVGIGWFLTSLDILAVSDFELPQDMGQNSESL